MGSERCYGWSSMSCSSASTMSAGDEVTDPMVRVELEAAEALADLAHLGVRESGGREWGSKGKRAKKRVKSESSLGDSALKRNPAADLAEQDQAVVSQRHCEKMCTLVLMEPEKTEQDPSKTELKAGQDSELPKPTRNRTTSYTSFCFHKSRRNLSEAEKEERRIRRVFANRESARQTIRRRQALCEDLTRKAADLAWENENLKREKELALKEYQSLETTNKHLREQMGRVIKAKAEESPCANKLPDVAVFSSSTNYPLPWYNRPPFTPVLWPSIIQSSNHVQALHGNQSAFVIPSNVSTPAAAGTSQEQENHMDVNGSRTPLYVLPYPWFFPLPDLGNGLQPQHSIGLKNKQEETSDNNQYNGSSSSKVVSDEENHYCFFPTKVKTEASSPVGFPPDGGGQHTCAHSKEILLTLSPLNCAQPASTIKHENRPISDDFPNIATRSTACDIVSASPEKRQESVSSPSKKLIDVVSAAEARKRRKELTKLKNLHGHQCRMRC